MPKKALDVPSNGPNRWQAATCREFEDSLPLNMTSPIEECLSFVDAEFREAMFQDLLTLEFTWLLERKRRIDIEHYLERFDGLRGIVAEVWSHVQKASVEGSIASIPREHSVGADDQSVASSDIFSLHDSVESTASPREARTVPGSLQNGRYVIGPSLGVGGSSEVFLAADTTANRQVAIRVPLLGRSNVEFHFQDCATQARWMILASGDGVPVVRDFVCELHETVPLHCLIVDYIEGQDIQTFFRQSGHPRAFLEISELFAKLADVLHRIHAAKLVNRDLKPRNIMIDAKARPWIVDFSLAFHLDETLQPGVITGTPSYMSPEQAAGDMANFDARSDIFSFGIILYEILAGRRPFYGTTIHQLFHEIINKEPSSLRNEIPGIPVALERICFKALSKRPSDRYPSCVELARDLRAWQR